MKLSTIITAALSIVFAASLGIITRVINPSENVNALWLVLAAACFFVVIYRLYGGFIAKKVLCLDDSRQTPATRFSDGRDFHATHPSCFSGITSRQ